MRTGAYVRGMLRSLLILLLLMLVLTAPAVAIGPDADGNYNIMKPEPGTPAAKHRARKPAEVERETTPSKGFGVKEDTRRGSSDNVYPTPLPKPDRPLPVPRQELARPAAKGPPPLYVPDTGRPLPNLPSVGHGPGGAETFQDKAARCAHQAGIYGPRNTGNPNAYIGGCVNQ